jgi:hypothetical protein
VLFVGGLDPLTGAPRVRRVSGGAFKFIASGFLMTLFIRWGVEDDIFSGNWFTTKY